VEVYLDAFFISTLDAAFAAKPKNLTPYLERRLNASQNS
jgi:hypothetical protein